MRKLKNKIERNFLNHCMSHNIELSNELKTKMKKIIEENNELKLEHIDYQIYKDKYNDIIQENKKIQNKNSLIIKQNIELMKQLKEIKYKNNNLTNNDIKKSKTKKNNKIFINSNKDLDKIFSNKNNYSIQSGVNTFMSEAEKPKEIKKSIRKEKDVKNESVKVKKNKEERKNKEKEREKEKEKEKEVNNKSKVKTKKNKEAKVEDGIIIKEFKGNKGNNKEIKEKNNNKVNNENRKSKDIKEYSNKEKKENKENKENKEYKENKDNIEKKGNKTKKNNKVTFEDKKNKEIKNNKENYELKNNKENDEIKKKDEIKKSVKTKENDKIKKNDKIKENDEIKKNDKVKEISKIKKNDKIKENDKTKKTNENNENKKKDKTEENHEEKIIEKEENKQINEIKEDKKEEKDSVESNENEKINNNKNNKENETETSNNTEIIKKDKNENENNANIDINEIKSLNSEEDDSINSINDEKDNKENNNNKENEEKKNKNNSTTQLDTEYLENNRKLYRKRLLKELVKIKIFKNRENLQKYFLRFFYNSLYLKKLKEEDTNIITMFKPIKEISIKKEDEKITNNPNKINENPDDNKNGDEIKIEFKNRNLYTEEELNRVKRNKELRDLFYNKIRERQNYLHKCFTRFYYKGLMLYMKNKNSENTNNTPSSNPINTINDNNNKEKEQQANNTSNNNPINNTNNNNTINEEKPKEEKPKPENPYAKARGLRRLLNKKGKEKLEMLRKYFYKFHQAGILLALRKGTKRASLYKKIEGIDLETAFNTVVNSQTMNEIEINEESNVKNFQAALDKKKEDKKFAEEMEKRKIEEEKKKKEEEEKRNELNKMKQKAIEILLYRADRHNKMIMKKIFEIYYLRSKVLSLNTYTFKKPRRVKTVKKKDNDKRKSVYVSLDHEFVDKIMDSKKWTSDKNIKEYKSEDEENNDVDNNK